MTWEEYDDYMDEQAKADAEAQALAEYEQGCQTEEEENAIIEAMKILKHLNITPKLYELRWNLNNLKFTPFD